MTQPRYFHIFAFVLFILVSAAEMAQARQVQVTGFVEEWNTITSSGTTPQINVLVNGPIKGNFGWTSWSLISPEWSESTIGLTYKLTDWAEASWSVGIETNDTPIRLAESLWVGKGRWSALFIVEAGGSGGWYRVLGTYKATDTIDVGVNSIYGFGTGPYVSKSFGKFSLWGAYAIDENKGIMSARLSF